MARRRWRARLDAPEPIAHIVERIERVDRYPKRPPVDEALWVLVVGKGIASRTRPGTLSPDGTLVVRTASAAWSQELSLLEPVVRAKLESHGVRVAKLRFQVGPVGPITTPFEIARLAKALPKRPLTADLEAALEVVEDDELRAAMKGAMERVRVD
jgi:hypothetical protein